MSFDKATEPTARHQLPDHVKHSERVRASEALIAQMRGSPRVTAQQQQLRAMFGRPAAQVNDDAGQEREADVMAAKAGSGAFEARGVARPVLRKTAPAGPSTAPVQRVEAADLAFWSEEELLALLKSSSFTELYAILQSLEELYKGQKPQPAHVQTVQKYVANQFEIVREQIDEFTAKTGYVAGRTLSVHALFGNLTLTLYPVEGKNPKAANKAAHTPHRPILDIEFDGRTPYARCYLGLYATAPDSRFKDVTANEQGEITLKDIGLMNLGNPFKALLWCEDYLSSQEHYTNKDEKPAPTPVVRSFLVPLSDAAGLLLGEGLFAGTRPLDQDRGAGQFGNLGDKDIYTKVLHPLIGSLVSFFHDSEDYKKASSKGQKKFGLVNLQEYLTGHREDPRSITAERGIAAQHGRLGHDAKFAAKYADVMKAYYDSVNPEETGFTGATKGSAPERRSSRIPAIFDGFPLVKQQIGLLSGEQLSKKSGSRFADWEPPRPSQAVARFRAFLDAYSQLPVTPHLAVGGVLAEGAHKTGEPEIGTSTSEEAQSAKVESRKVEPTKSEPEKVEPQKGESGIVESGKVEREDPRNQYAVIEGEVGPAIPASWFRLRVNPGGGDCLFHALEGRTLSALEMLITRGKVANVRKRMPDSALQSTANAHVAAATITQTPSLWHLTPLVHGRDAVPNRVLALLQAVPGVYAGTEELVQWCQLKGRTVYVVDQDGSVMMYTGAGSQQLYPAGKPGPRALRRIRRLVDQRLLVLYKSPAHWELIEGLADQFGPKVVPKPKPEVIL